MARYFTAANTEYFSTASSPVTTGDSDAYTLAMWFYPAAVDLNYIPLHLWDDSADLKGHYIHLDNVERVRASSHSGSSSEQSIRNGPFVADVWAHAAAVFAGSASRIAYYNGAAATPDTATVGSISADTLWIGARGRGTPSSTSAWDGALAEVAVWQMNLDPAEISILAAGYSPLFVRPNFLKFYAPLNSAKTGDEIDVVGGLTLTDNGTVTASVPHPRIIYPRRRQQILVPSVAAPAAGGGGFLTLLGVG